MSLFSSHRSRLRAQSNGRLSARLSPREIGRERDSSGLPDTRYCPCNKATNVPKMRDRSEPRPCDKLRKTGNESHSSPIHVLRYRPRADAMAGIPAHADAWRILGRQWARTLGGVGGSGCAPRHRHARRSGLGHRLQPPELCQSGSAQRRPTGARRARHLRLPQSFHRQGPARRQHPRLRDREPAGARL